jgi:cell division protein FtsB
MLTNDDLAAIRERAEKATPGKWYTVGHDAPLGTPERLMQILRRPISDADGTFIAAARSDIPALLAHIDALTARVAELERETEQLATSGVGSGATPIMPDGWEQNAQPTDPLLLALSMGMKVGPAVAQQAAAEIARLRAEVERLTIHAARLEDRRAALVRRVAEAVRGACAERGHSLWYDAESECGPSYTSDGIRAMDLGPIVAAAIAKDGE